MTDKYKDTMGRFLTQSLFKETHEATKVALAFAPPFTLKEHDVDGYVSMRRLYLEMGDPTEYKFALEVLGSWDHWQRLLTCAWFKPFVEQWREELKVKLRSEAIDMLMNRRADNDKVAQWFADGRFTGKKIGRPSKEELQRRARMVDSIPHEDIDNDAQRLGLEDETSTD